MIYFLSFIKINATIFLKMKWGSRVLTYFLESDEMDLNLIKNKVLTVFEKHNLTLFSITVEKMGAEKVLTILIDNELEHQTLEPIHMEVLDLINDDLPDDYYLELSTVGIERPLRTLDEVIANIGKFVYIESEQFIGDATIDDVNDGILDISFHIKGRPKKLQLSYENIKFIRQAVKF